MNVLIMLEPYFLPLLVALLVLLAGAIPLYLHHRQTQQQLAQRAATPHPTPTSLAPPAVLSPRPDPHQASCPRV